jgi:hypothetical protein
MNAIHNMAGAFGGELVGRDRGLVPGPGHSPRDRSMSVAIDPAAPGGFIINSFVDDDCRLPGPYCGPARHCP